MSIPNDVCCISVAKISCQESMYSDSRALDLYKLVHDTVVTEMQYIKTILKHKLLKRNQQKTDEQQKSLWTLYLRDTVSVKTKQKNVLVYMLELYRPHGHEQ